MNPSPPSLQPGRNTMATTWRTRLLLATWLLGASLYGGTTARAGAEPSPEGVAFFERKVRPVLVEHCYECHSARAKKVRGGLLLDSRDDVLRGGDSGPALVPGHPDRSLLVKAVRHTDERLRMPPRHKLPAPLVADLEAWVKMGAPDPRTAAAAPPRKKEIDFVAARKFWSFRPVADPPVPAVKDRSWPRAPVDHFVLARMEAKGLRPAPQADRRTLIRRVTFD